MWEEKSIENTIGKETNEYGIVSKHNWQHL